MNSTGSDGNDLLRSIRSSPGMEHINRSHHRTFSLNIFQMNAQELIEISRRVSDPDEALRLWSVENREASLQIHREVTRRIHNFVAAALTLVDHTREFMREYYGDKPVFDRYQARIDSQLSNEPIVRFVKDLRNFMVHKGLPPSEMFLEFHSDPTAPNRAGDITTGIRTKASELLTWGEWSGPARAYIEGCGAFVDVRALAESYTEKIGAFHDWLQTELHLFHSADLAELRTFEASIRQPGSNALSHLPTAEAQQGEIDEVEERFSFTQRRSEIIDSAGVELCRAIRQLDMVDGSRDAFASERPISATITDRDIIGAPQQWGTDKDGNRVFMFIYKSGRGFGIDELIFAQLQSLTDSVLRSDWARRALSRSYVDRTVIGWLQQMFHGVESRSLSEAIRRASKEAIRSLELWAPIAHLEVQTAFLMGPVTISPISKAMLDEQQALAIAKSPNQSENVTRLFDDLRRRMQGLAAVIVRAECESKKISEDGRAVAEIAIGLLRFLSPAATNFPMVCANALLGAEIVPSSHLLIVGDGMLSYEQSRLSPYSPSWRLSEKEWRDLRPTVDLLGTLVRPEGLSPFALAVRSSLLLFGKGATFPNPVERLSYALSSLEVLLLRHSVEPPQFNVAQRMSVLLAEDRQGRDEIEGSVREAYRLRARQDLAPPTPREINSIARFLRYASRVLAISLSNVDRVATVVDFVAAIDTHKIARSPRQSHTHSTD